MAEGGATEFGRRRADVDDATRGLNALDDRVVVLGDLVDERQRTLLPRASRHRLLLFGGDGQSLQRPRGITPAEVSLLGRPSLGACLVVPTIDHSTHGWVVRLDLFDHGLEVLHRRQITATEQLQRLVRGQV